MTDDLYREIDEEIRDERRHVAVRKYAPYVICIIFICILVIGGWQYFQWRQYSYQMNFTTRYLELVKLIELQNFSDLSAVTPEQNQALTGFGDLSNHQAEGSLKALASLNQAGLLARVGRLEEALSIWERIADAPGLPQELKSLAGIFWVQWQLDKAEPKVVQVRLDLLARGPVAFQPVIRELQAMLDIRNRKFDDAKQVLTELLKDPIAPNELQQRAVQTLKIIENMEPEQ